MVKCEASKRLLVRRANDQATVASQRADSDFRYDRRAALQIASALPYGRIGEGGLA